MSEKAMVKLKYQERVGVNCVVREDRELQTEIAVYTKTLG